MTITLNKNTRPVMSRPGFQIDDKSYSAAWLEGKDEEGNSKQVTVVFSYGSGEIYCDEELEIEHKSFDEAPMEIRFEASPRPGTSLTTEAFIRHIVDQEPLLDLKEVFGSVRDSIDRFVAFDDMLGTQMEMSEFLACWTIATYATQAFGTVGYLWPTGEKGSGKTQCLKTVVRMSYLGLITTSSSTFPAIRNNAILGGTIGFDDCENIRGMEPNKRELLLAGNTKGAQVALMEQGKREGDWQTKYIDAFAPRSFTSISIPDPVLASRTITPQLIKSSDKERTRRDPSNIDDWIVDPSEIVDNVWLHVAKGFSSIIAKKPAVSEAVEAHGRDFDIFQPSLTIAKWLEDEGGVDGLFDRMVALMGRYLEQKVEIQLPSPAEILVPALYRQVFKAGQKSLTTSMIRTIFQQACNSIDITDPTYTEMDNQRIGQLLGRLGFTKSKSHSSRRSWVISEADVRRVAKNQSISLPDKEPDEQPDDNVSEDDLLSCVTVVPAQAKQAAIPVDHVSKAPWD